MNPVTVPTPIPLRQQTTPHTLNVRSTYPSEVTRKGVSSHA